MPLAAINQSPETARQRQLKLVKISKGISSRTRRFVLLPLALLLAVAAGSYTVAWMYYIRLQPKGELGFDLTIGVSGLTNEVRDVWPGGPAEQAGLRPHDRIIEINGKKLSPGLVVPLWGNARPGDVATMTVERPGSAQPVVLRAIFRGNSSIQSPARIVANEIIGLDPLIFLVIGLAVLFMRLEDPHAWLLALLFTGFIALTARPPYFEVILKGAVRTLILGFRAVFEGSGAPLFYFLFAVFPASSPVERRARWIKWLTLGLGVSFGISGIAGGEPRPWPILDSFLGFNLAYRLMLASLYGTVFLGLVSLASNVVVAPSPEARRKLRIVLAGALFGVTPAALLRAISDFTQTPQPFWLNVVFTVLLWFFPLSFAYAVVKHRVLEIPVLLKRSARYVLVRRGLAVFVVFFGAAVVAIFSVAVSLFFPIGPKLAMAIGVVFGVALTSASAPGLRRITQQIDRAFFRGAYDARVILQELAQRTPRFNTRNELATEVAGRVNAALHPVWIAVYVEAGPDYLETQSAGAPAIPDRIRKDSPLLQYLAHGEESWDAYTDPDSIPALGRVFSSIQPDCIVGFPARSGETLGMLVLGGRLSEEPYSSEDKMLLRSVASQAGTALENLRMAEDIAERLETERKAEREMDIARQVQRKLFPQAVPHVATLEIIGTCMQTSAVGGDYYDFVELGPGRLGLVVADVAGKGISAALLMANLQANLRSQYTLALENLPLLLKRVNHLFYENTEPSHYTTMVFAWYDKDSRRLVYANCGHCPPLLVRKDGVIDRLCSTATVLGLFPDWECEMSETMLGSGDILALYSDGVTEAANERDEEFGEQGLRQAILANRHLPLADLLTRLLDEVHRFSSGRQSDDVTIILARGR